MISTTQFNTIWNYFKEENQGGGAEIKNQKRLNFIHHCFSVGWGPGTDWSSNCYVQAVEFNVDLFIGVYDETADVVHSKQLIFTGWYAKLKELG